MSFGWDVDNEAGKTQFLRDVIQEESIDVEDEISKKNPDYALRIQGFRKLFIEVRQPSIVQEPESYPHVTPEIIYRLNNLLDSVEPGQFREYLLEIYHLYIIHEHDSLPYNFRELADGMLLLFDFLKFAQEELSKRNAKSDCNRVSPSACHKAGKKKQGV